MKVFIESVIEKVGEEEVQKDIYLESDEYQFIIKKYNGKITVGKDGKEREVYETMGYYTSIEHAINALVKMKIKASTASDLNQLMADIGRIKEFISEKLGGAA